MAARAEPLARGDELVVQADGGRREEAVGEIPAANGQELAQDGPRKRGGATIVTIGDPETYEG